MQRLKVGKLYSCSKYFLLLYPDKEVAAYSALARRFAAAESSYSEAAYWSKTFGISYCNTETPLLVLSVNEKYVEVLAGDKRGWIIYQGWLELKEIYA